MTLSIVSPVYRAETLVQPLVDRIRAAVAPLQVPFEIVLVEDGSPDGSWLAIERMAAQYPEVLGVQLSRNFGQHPAITAGLAQARGEWVVVMDCDLQDRPEEIPRLWAATKQFDSDYILAQRQFRQDPWYVKLGSKWFYQLLSFLSGAALDPSVANFGIYRSSVINAVLQMPERNRSFPIMVNWAGFRRQYLMVEHAERLSGRSTYSLGKRARLALDIMLAYSDKPLYFAVNLGFVIATVSFVVAVAYLVLAILGRFTVSGFASLMISLWFLSGLMILILGIVGLYLTRVYDGIKGRPLYIVRLLTPKTDKPHEL